MYRIRNEDRWIKKSFDETSKICEQIVVVNNNSSDDTLKICEAHNHVTKIHTQNLPFDEARDKNTLLEMAMELNPDFVINLSGDEIFMPGADKILFEELEVIYPNVSVFNLQLLDIWDKPNQYRIDGVYNWGWQPRILRLKNQPDNIQFSETKWKGNMHSPGVPQNAIGFDNAVNSKAKLLHYGKFEESQRKALYDSYKKFLGSDEDFDNYEFIISDKGRMSGRKGIKLKNLPEGYYHKDINMGKFNDKYKKDCFN